MPIQENVGPSEGIQPILRKILANQKVINDAISGGGGGGGNVNLASVGGIPVSDPLPVAPAVGASFPIAYGDSPSIDAFDRLRVSDPQTIFDAAMTADEQPLLWDLYETGTGSGTFIPARSAFEMEVSANNDEVIRQTRQYYPYQPGKSQLILLTFAMEEDANVRSRVGLFEDNDGIFIEKDGSDCNLVIRSSATGSVVENRVPQASWNVDTFSDLDLSKTQIFVVDIEWLGVGRVRCGFVIDGIIRYAHYFTHANVSAFAGPYMKTATLPARYEITAIGAPSGATSLYQICASIMSEGGQEEALAFPFAVRNSVSRPSNGTTKFPIISIRPKATFNSQINRASIALRNLFFVPDAGHVAVDVYYGGTLTGPSWASVNPNSTIEYDESATALTGGILIATTVIYTASGSRGIAQGAIEGKLPWGLDKDGLDPSQISICMTDIGTNANCWAGFSWQEYR
jgi:hypothetical protein